MKEYFSGDFFIHLQESMCRSVIDTFRLMFELEISLMAKENEKNSEKFIYSYMDLASNGVSAHLTLAISQTLVETISDKVAPKPSEHSEVIRQDVVCEILNIVGSHLRSFIVDHAQSALPMDVTFPKAGEPLDLDKSNLVFHLHFKINADECLRLHLSYAASEPKGF